MAENSEKGDWKDKHDFDAIREIVRSPGLPLDSATRDFMEARFNHDFSRVRIHTGDESAASAASLSARAYTVGPNIVFGSGGFVPERSADRQLLAHELTHIVQQGTESVVGAALSVGPPCDKLESQAQQMSRAIAEPHCFDPTITHAPSATIQRQFITPLGQGGGLGGLMERDRKGPFSDAGTKHVLNVPEAIQGGVERIVELDESAMQEANLAQRCQMLKQLAEGWRVGGSKEEAIILVISTTPPAQSADLLSHLTTQLVEGIPLLKRLDSVVDFGNNLELHAALSMLRIRSQGAAKAVENLEAAPHLPWYDSTLDGGAIFKVNRSHYGRIVVKYPVHQYFSPDFGKQIQAVSGRDFDPEQVFLVDDYELNKTVPVVARELVGYNHASVRNFLSRAATISSLAMPLGPARTLGTKALVIVIERVLPVMTALVHENRRLIIKWAPDWGPKFIHFVDVANTMIAAFGLYQFARVGINILTKWRNLPKRPTTQGAIANPAAEKAASALENEANKIFAELDALQGQNPAPTVGESAPNLSGAIKAEPRPEVMNKVETLSEPLPKAATGDNAAILKELSTPVPSAPVLVPPREIPPSSAQRKTPPTVPAMEPPIGAADIKKELGLSALKEAPRKRRESLRKTLQDQVAELEETLRISRRESDLLQIEIINNQARINRTNSGKEINDMAELLDRQKELAEQSKHLIDERRLIGNDWKEARALIGATEDEYLKALTGAAAKREGHMTVRARGVDEIFGTVGSDLTVDHIVPRSRIFAMKGFELLRWEQQIALFDWTNNLRLISRAANGARGNLSFRSWPRKSWAQFTKDENLIKQMITLESELEIQIQKMIANPSTIPLTGG